MTSTMQPAVTRKDNTIDLRPHPAKDAVVVEPSVPDVPAPARPPGRAVPFVVGGALTILGILLLSLAAQMTLVGTLHHDRAQRVAYDRLRSELAQATAPVAATDDKGALLAMGTPVAVLSIPRLALREVVLEGTTSGVLRDGVGHRRDSVLPGQVGGAVLMGRQAAYGGPFALLDQLRRGDQVVVLTGQGRQVFEVTAVRFAGDKVAVVPPDAGEGRLTLITATGTPFLPSDALRVDARLMTPVQATPAPALRAGMLPESEQALRGDPAAWITVVLWSQALLLAALALTFAARRWGAWQTWVVGVPLVGWLCLALADQVARLLPNLI